MRELREKLQRRLAAGDEIAIAEISDFEARRELLRKEANKQLQRLNELIADNLYNAIDTEAMRRAAEIWADLRKRGRPTASSDRLDGDVILAAQVERFADHLVVTKNISHLAGICNAVPLTSI